MKKILVPVDFSDASLQALQVACQIAVRTEATVLMVHINEMAAYLVPAAELSYNTSALDIAQYSKDTGERLELLKTSLLTNPRFSKLSVKTMVMEGLIVQVIKDMVDEVHVDLVVMGTLGVSGWKEVFVGSNTERVIRFAACPVLVVPEGTDELEIEKVVVPTTLKPDQMKVFQTVKTWQEIFGFEVHALYVNDPLGAMTNHIDLEEEKKNQMSEAGLENVYLHVFGLTLDTENAIRNYAGSVGAGLIIMGTHQNRGLSHLWFGSVTENTANHAHIPVLAVPVSVS